MRRLRFIQPATSFRSAYAYDNNLYIVAGELIEAVSGRTWEEFVAERLLNRVGMSRTRVRYSEAAGDQNVARPHTRIDGAVRPVEADAYADSDNYNPAGSIYSSAEDMGKWLSVLLQGGRLPDGSRLFSQSTVRELMTLVTPMPIVEPPSELALQHMNFNGYALGFQVHDYRGRKVVTHTGGNLGNVTRATSSTGSTTRSLPVGAIAR